MRILQVQIRVRAGYRVNNRGDETQGVSLVQHAHGKTLALTHEQDLTLVLRSGYYEALSLQITDHFNGISLIRFADRALQIQLLAHSQFYMVIGHLSLASVIILTKGITAVFMVNADRYL
jgi:hypothetical protein